jgi:hypothetical protein
LLSIILKLSNRRNKKCIRNINMETCIDRENTLQNIAKGVFL